MKKCYIAAVLLTSVFAFTACNKETVEPAVEDVVTEDSQKETVDPVENAEMNTKLLFHRVMIHARLQHRAA